jgi:hypothetical protein
MDERPKFPVDTSGLELVDAHRDRPTKPIVWDETTSDKLAASRGFWNAVGFMAGVYLLAGFVVAMLVLL